MRQYLLLQGYCLLIVNFRGSIGYGGNAMNSLLGNIGVNDVEDCGELTKLALEKFKHVIDEKKVAAYGGSHGGFLSAWLIGHPKYKDLWATACMRNPVLDMNYMRSATDIPDWIEACVLNRELDFGKATPEDVLKIHERSPISVV
jgi:acylaminoacyl-peptidase